MFMMPSKQVVVVVVVSWMQEPKLKQYEFGNTNKNKHVYEIVNMTAN